MAPLKNLIQAQGACVDFTMPGNGPPGMGDGCRIQMKINPAGEVNWQLKIQVGTCSNKNSIKIKTFYNFKMFRQCPWGYQAR